MKPGLTPTQRTDRIGVLDGLRALAVIAVMLDHVMAFETELPHSVAAFAFWAGLAGVRYFFILSGFVITRRLLAEFEATRTVSLRAFWIRRAFRILPAFWVYLAAVGCLGALGLIRTNLAGLGWSLAFLANIAPVDWFHYHLWSLSVEEQFYLIAPIAAWALFGQRRRYSAIGLAVAFLGCLFWHRLEHQLDGILPGAHLEFLSMFRFILCGVALSLFAEEVAPRLKAIPGQAVAWMAIATFLVRDMPENAYWLKIFLQLTQPVLITVVVGWTATQPQRCAWLARRALLWVGRRSYSLYLWQQLFLGPRKEYVFAVNLLTQTLSLVLPFVMASLSYRWIERPLTAVGLTWASAFSRRSESRESNRAARGAT